jgi:mono/diheme cytochrome c family protein
MATFRITHRPGQYRAAIVLLSVMLIGAASRVTVHGDQPSGAADHQPASGPELFKTHCATCHGAEGRGNGPLASALRQTPTDLTELSKRNGGTFPGVRVRRLIDGRDVESHGDREMPVWGDAFRSTRDGRSAEMAAARIAALVDYLASIQHREAE